MSKANGVVSFSKPRRDVQPKLEPSDGRIVAVHYPRVVEPAGEGGHSLYAGPVCWDVVQDYDKPYDGDEPLHLAEGDFEWLDA
jgi:hypothetical protein